MRKDWRTEEYDPFQVNKKSSDERGHSFFARVRLPDDWAGQIEEIIGNGVVSDYRTVADFIRDAVYHRMRFWQLSPKKTSPELDRVLRREEAVQKLRRSQAIIQAFETFVGELEDTATAMARNEDWKGLWSKLNELDDIAREAFDEPYLGRVLDRVEYWRKRANRF